MLSPEDLSTMQLLRSRILMNEQIPPEELGAALRLMRADRLSAATRAKTTKSRSAGKAKAPAQAAGALLGQLGIPGV
jgi:hypothetical protein